MQQAKSTKTSGHRWRRDKVIMGRFYVFEKAVKYFGLMQRISQYLMMKEML